MASKDSTTHYDRCPLLTPGVPTNGSDPSVRTLHVLAEAMEGLRANHEIRLDGMDKAIEVAHEDLVRVPTAVQTAVAALKDFFLEKFSTVGEKFQTVNQKFTVVQTQFDEREKALAAALLTAEKAVGKQAEAFTAATTKSEAAATKQADAISERLTSMETNTTEKFAGVASQIARLDNVFTSLISNAAGNKEKGESIMAKLVGAAVAGGFIATVLQFLMHLNGAAPK